ncbi:hypothetical protein K439DRAFT_978547 [Ramaria rubella]|nr:hypothetical protein K439DRAFT_978547 [Ramaria rubella]
MLSPPISSLVLTISFSSLAVRNDKRVCSAMRCVRRSCSESAAAGASVGMSSARKKATKARMVEGPRGAFSWFCAYAWVCASGDEEAEDVGDGRDGWGGGQVVRRRLTRVRRTLANSVGVMRSRRMRTEGRGSCEGARGKGRGKLLCGGVGRGECGGERAE